MTAPSIEALQARLMYRLSKAGPTRPPGIFLNTGSDFTAYRKNFLLTSGGISVKMPSNKCDEGEKDRPFPLREPAVGASRCGGSCGLLAPEQSG